MTPPRSEVRVVEPDGTGWTGVGWSWRWDLPVRMASTAVFGGGVGLRAWIANITVERNYAAADPRRHAESVAAEFGEPAAGCVLMTAFDVRRSLCLRADDVHVQGSVAIGAVCWAADADGASATWRPGTVNIVAWVPEPLHDAALLNLMTTVAEAKCQAFGERGIPGTSTPSDAIAVACPAADPSVIGERGWYGGPRSHWGARIGRATRRFVLDGIDADGAIHGLDDRGDWRSTR